MKLFARLRLWLKWVVKPQQLECEMETEVRFHIESYAAELVRKGVPEQEAMRRACIEFGGIESHKDAMRASLGLRLWGELCSDLRYGVRMLRRSPGFVAIAILTLALGIGANTAIFSLIDAVMLKMLPVKKPEQLVLLSWTAPGWPRMPYMIHSLSGNTERDKNGRSTSTSFSYAIFDDIRARNQVFSGVLAFSDSDRLNVGLGGQAGLAEGQLVSGDFFSTLGVPAVVGRTILPTDDTVGASPTATISYSYWVRRFGRDPRAVGKRITVNGVPFTLVGVAAPEFFGVQPGASIDVWIPLRTQPQVDPGWTAYATPGEVSRFTARDDWWVVIMGRLKPGISERQARAALDVFVRQNLARVESPPATWRSPDMALEPPQVELANASKGLNSLRQEFSKPLSVLMVVVGLVLLISCANVANLLLARATSRQREIAVRLSLGAGRSRLIRQLLTESVLLAVAGGALGVILAYWASGILLAFMSSGRDPVILHVSPNLGVLGFTAAVSVLTGILFGLAPALRGTRLDLTPALKEGGAKIVGSGGASRGLRLELGKALLVAQVAMSLLLLIGAGLFVRTLANLEGENIGFDRHNLLLFGIDATQTGSKGERLATLYEELRKRIEAVPGVRSASLSRHTFIDGGVTIDGVSIQGYAPKPGESDNGSVTVHVNAVGPEFFETFGIPLMLGRTIGDGDTAAAPNVAAVNGAFASKYLGGASPIGRRCGFGDEKTSSDIVIVGLVGDARYGHLRDEAPATVYVPYAQNLKELGEMTFEVRTAGDPTHWIGAMRQAVQGLDRNLPLFDVKTQTEQIEQATFQERLFARLTGLFSTLALLLACVGLYGVTSYAVARKTSELGIRLALGAGRGDVLWMVLRDSLLPVITGAVIGVPIALAATRYISSELYGIRATDPATMMVATLMLAAAAGIAGFLPARRAAKVDPMAALRCE